MPVIPVEDSPPELAVDPSPDHAIDMSSPPEETVPGSVVQAAEADPVPTTGSTALSPVGARVEAVGPAAPDEGPSVSRPTLMRFDVVGDDLRTKLTTEDPMQPLCVTATPPCTASPLSSTTCSPSLSSPAGLTSALIGVASASASAPSIEAALDGVIELSPQADVPPAEPGRPVGQVPPSPSWRPAEEVLPLVPVEDPNPGHKYVTYSRRFRNHATAPAGAATLAEATEDFIDCIAKELPVVLPTPARPAGRGRGAPGSVPAPRCSRRIAKLPPEFDFQAKSSVAQALGFSGKDKYTKFFCNPLCRRHVAALGARIGKELPYDPLPTTAILVSS